MRCLKRSRSAGLRGDHAPHGECGSPASTIRSRCVMMKLRNIKDQLVKKYLMEQMEIPDYKADVCVAFAQGTLDRVLGHHAGAFRVF